MLEGREGILLLEEEMRNAKFGILDLGERGMKVETNEVLGACYRGGTNLSEKIQVKGPLRRNRTLSN